MTRFPAYPDARRHEAISTDLETAIHFHQRNELAQASRVYRDILKRDPDHPDALQYLAAICIQVGDLGEAEVLYERAMQAKDCSCVVYANYGSVLHQSGRYDEAIANYEKALAINPDYADALYNLGNSLFASGRFDAAIPRYERALALDPAHVGARYNLANTLQKLNRHHEAITSYDMVAALEPGHALACLNRGNALRALRLHEEALASYDRALSIKRDFTDALCNRGGVLKDLKRFDEALKSYLSALNIDPMDAEIYWNISLTLLLLGNYKDGFEFYEWRKKIRNPLGDRSFPKPLWLGQDRLEGKTILIHEEQGIGDIIQFCRYLKLLQARGAKVIFAVTPRLAALAASLGQDIEIRSIEEASSDFDFHCPLISLPHAFNTDLTSIPSATPYIFADGAQVAKLRGELSRNGTQKICGLSWRSNNVATGDTRSIHLSDLFEKVDPRDHIFVNLQYGDVSGEIAALKAQSEIEVISIAAIDNYNDLDGFAALVDACDVIVTIDNTTAHIAGALNKRTYLMLPHVPDWRWLLDREDSPWYPSLRLFRQPADGDWTDVFVALDQALREDADSASPV